MVRRDAALAARRRAPLGLVRLAPRLRPVSDDELGLRLIPSQSAGLADRNVRSSATPTLVTGGRLLNLRSAREMLDAQIDSVISTGAGSRSPSFRLRTRGDSDSLHRELCSRSTRRRDGRLLAMTRGITCTRSIRSSPTRAGSRRFRLRRLHGDRRRGTPPLRRGIHHDRHARVFLRTA